MDPTVEIEKRLKEAEVYRSQGLLKEAKDVYDQVADLVEKLQPGERKQGFLDSIAEGKRLLKEEFEEVKELTQAARVSSKAQDTMKNLFSYPAAKSGRKSDLEGALALMNFGQFERALEELHRLVKQEALRCEAAENILRCHLELGSTEHALAEYQNWRTGDIFSEDEIEKLGAAFEGILREKGIDKSIEQLWSGARVSVDQDLQIEILDFIFIEITFENGPLKDEAIDIGVDSQTGRLIRILVPESRDDLLDQLYSGARLGRVRYFTSQAFLNGAATVLSRRPIGGDFDATSYVVDLRMEID
jgi:hypothetical protein